jgi:hypothetical protein
LNAPPRRIWRRRAAPRRQRAHLRFAFGRAGAGHDDHLVAADGTSPSVITVGSC